MKDIKSLLELPSNSEINWGDMAREYLTPAQQEVYEANRIPAWNDYQAIASANQNKPWQEVAASGIMTEAWEAYRITTRHAFATAYASPKYHCLGELLTEAA